MLLADYSPNGNMHKYKGKGKGNLGSLASANPGFSLGSAMKKGKKKM